MTALPVRESRSESWLCALSRFAHSSSESVVSKCPWWELAI